MQALMITYKLEGTMNEKFKKYLKEARKLDMNPKEIANLYGKEILEKSKSGYDRIKGSEVDKIAVVVYDFLADKDGAHIELAEHMGDEDLKETAKQILKKYGK